MEAALAETWHLTQARIEHALREALPTSDACPETLREAMEYSLLAGGKRLRPVLVLMASQACGGSSSAALPAACAIEMIHTYSLIHDDLPAMDDDDYRRGRPTNHQVYGQAGAILAGDALLTRAFEILAEGMTPAGVATACCVDLAAAAGATGMVGGQILDLEAEQALPPADQEAALLTLDRIHGCKTAALIASAASLGARAAQASEEVRQSLSIYGQNLGLAFQITDDLLDVLGDQEKMGKGVGKDAGRGKLTYPGLLGVDGSRQAAETAIETARNQVRPLGPPAEPLIALANFVLQRDH